MNYLDKLILVLIHECKFFKTSINKIKQIGDKLKQNKTTLYRGKTGQTSSR
jgi:hypothetical protein